MEHFTLDSDIQVLCVTATSFPEGVLNAHQRLHLLIPPFSNDRRYFGLSRPNDKGEIIYKAAAEVKQDGEARNLGLEVISIKKGKYVCITIIGYKKDVQLIRDAFQSLLAVPGLAPDGYCVEWYLEDEDVKCMVRLKD